jgi:F-type H+-transporting ATPase subunit c
MKKISFTMLFLLLFFVAVPLALAAEGVGEGNAAGWSVKGACAIGAGIAIGIAACGGGLGQGKAVAAGLEGIARNPGAAGQILTPLIIGLALIESLVIYALVIAFLLQLKI